MALALLYLNRQEVMRGVIKMELSLREIESFLRETGTSAFFLNSGKDSFAAGKDWWALIKENKDMAPGNYIFTLRYDLHYWRFISENEGEKIATEIRKKIRPAFNARHHFEADFERDKEGNIVIIRVLRTYSRMGPNYNIPLLYRFVIPGLEKVETVSVQTFDFFYRKYSEPAFYMQASEKNHYPIVFFNKKSPWVLISPVSWRQNGSFIYPEEGYLPIFNS